MSHENTTQSSQTGESTEEFNVTAIAAEIAAAESIAEHWANVIKALKEQLLANLPVGSHEAGPLTVQIRAGANRFDAAAAAEAYPIEDFSTLYKQAFDVDAFKQFVAPVVVDRFKKPGKPSVVIK